MSARQADRAGGRRQLAHQGPEQGCLPHAVVAENADDLATIDREGDAGQDRYTSIPRAQARDLKHGVTCPGRFPSPEGRAALSIMSSTRMRPWWSTVTRSPAADELHIVLDDNNASVAIDFTNERRRPRDLVGRHAGGRLVEQDQLRPPRHDHADVHPLALAVGECSDALLAKLGQRSRSQVSRTTDPARQAARRGGNPQVLGDASPSNTLGT